MSRRFRKPKSRLISIVPKSINNFHSHNWLTTEYESAWEAQTMEKRLAFLTEIDDIVEHLMQQERKIQSIMA